MTTSTSYLRVRITGTMKVCSELHLGDGADHDSKCRINPHGQAAEGGHYRTTCVDHNMRPYIPGSSLRGALRDWAKEADNQCSALNQRALFGPDTGDQANAIAGQLRVADMTWKGVVDIKGTEITSVNENLPFWCDTRKTTIRQSTTIDPITRTAKAHQLFQYEMVPVGTQFNVTLEMHGTPSSPVEHAKVEYLLNILAAWDGNHAHARLGHGGSKDRGRMRWGENQEVTVVTQEAMEHWLEPSTSTSTKLPWSKLKAGQFNILAFDRPTHSAVVELTPCGPYLSNEAGLVPTGTGEAKLVYARTSDDRPKIPAASLKGWIRNCAHKIAATIAHQHYDVPAADAHQLMESWIGQLMGDEGHKSWLAVSDAEATAARLKHTQIFTAIDRFTGGVSHIKNGPSLVTVEAALNPLGATLHFDDRLFGPDQAHWHGLLLLVFRDALADQMWLGWGQAKGYGQFEIAITLPGGAVPDNAIKNATQLLAHPWVIKDGNGWIKALHDSIEGHIKLQQSHQQEASHAG